MIKKSKAKFANISEEELCDLKYEHKDKIGYSNNNLTVIDIIGKDHHNFLYTMCRCECGEFIEVSYKNVKLTVK